jgi:hypothetical protein
LAFQDEQMDDETIDDDQLPQCPNGHLAGQYGCDFCNDDGTCDPPNSNLAEFLEKQGWDQYDIKKHYMLTNKKANPTSVHVNRLGQLTLRRGSESITMQKGEQQEGNINFYNIMNYMPFFGKNEIEMFQLKEEMGFKAASTIQKCFRSFLASRKSIYMGEQMKVIYIGTRSRQRHEFHVSEGDTIGAFKTNIWNNFHGEEQLEVSVDDYMVRYSLKTVKSNKPLSDILTFKQLGFTIENIQGIPYEFELNFGLSPFGGKRACPNVTDQDKLDRLILKQKADTRPVAVAEIDAVVDALNTSMLLIPDLPGNNMVIQQKLATLTAAELNELLEKLPGGMQGKALTFKNLEVGKTLFDTIAKVEDGIHTLKSLYSYLVVLYMAAYARDLDRHGHFLTKFDPRYWAT